MDKSSAVSDTQTLLQSMLQRLKIQTPSERSSAPTQEQAPSPAIGLNGGSSFESTVYQFGDSTKSKQQETSPPSVWTNSNPWSLQSSDQPQSPKEILSPVEARTPSWGFTNSHATPGFKIPRQERKQLKISRIKVSDDNSSISSFRTTDNTLNSTNLSTPSPTSSISAWTTSEEHSGMWGEGVFVGDARIDNINVSEKLMQRRTSGKSKKKWGDPGQKRWTQKVKERWKERHNKGRDGKQKQESNEVTENNHCPPLPNPSESNTTAVLTEEENIIQPQAINNGPAEAPPSPLDHMSESIFSFDSLNLMEEIFTGQEWANFFQSSATSQPESTGTTSDKTMKSQSSIIRSAHREQKTGSQWDYKEAADSNLRTAPSQMNSESFQQDMDITEHASNQTRTSDVSLSVFLNYEFLKGQTGLSDSNQTQSMDLSLGQTGNEEQTKYQPQLLTPVTYQSSTTEASVHQPLSSKQDLNQSQPSDPKHPQPERVHEEYIPLLDLSYLQPKYSSSLKMEGSLSRKMEGSLSRKRGHCTLRRGSSDRGGLETGEMDECRNSAMTSRYPLYSAPSLSPASSVSSLQNSISHDSESSASTETVIKKRRMENTRRVRFSEEVVYLPHLVLSEDYDEDDDDADDDDDSYDYDNEDEDEADEEGENDCQEELQSRPSIPNWISALRIKTKRKPKLKLPQMQSTPTKFKSSKS
ncbi:hypothetical protein NFI96_033977 [Prochilodus magdalenae]|nr:hypothetical protein NFI96_033977 [Prochilodus magdalenae]